MINSSDKLHKNKVSAVVGASVKQDSFRKQVEDSLGKLITCSCTFCGSTLTIHEKTDYSFCSCCGEKVLLKDYKDCRFSAEATARMSSEELYRAATYYPDSPNIKLLESAASAGNKDACKFLTVHYFLNGNYKLSKKHGKQVKKASADMIFCYNVSKYHDGDINARTAFSSIKALKKEEFASEKLKSVFDKEKDGLQKLMKEEERKARERERESNYSYSSYGSSSCGSSYTSSGSIPSTWSSNAARDYRTGERLYNDGNGNVVNSRGEIVPTAWQE